MTLSDLIHTQVNDHSLLRVTSAQVHYCAVLLAHKTA